MKTDSKSLFWALLDVLLLVLIFALVFGAKAVDRYGASLAPARVITVSAEGEAVAKPDVATINFSVVSEGSDPVKVQEENTKKINPAIEFVKKQGIDEKDIKTSQYNLSPRYEYDENKHRSFVVGYQLTQSVTIKIRDFTKISIILGGLPGLGVNQISRLQFEVDDQDAYLSQAREEAFSKAATKAEVMARQNDVRIGGVVTFSESQGFVPPYPAYRTFEDAVVSSGAPIPIIEPGSQEVKVVVSVTYEIK
ncbi:MAG: SIMPL domain-containing protein [bacterium]|nr:SIMPL domain-containing protein [bacterium]